MVFDEENFDEVSDPYVVVSTPDNLKTSLSQTHAGQHNRTMYAKQTSALLGSFFLSSIYVPRSDKWNLKKGVENDQMDCDHILRHFTSQKYMFYLIVVMYLY